jgi:hypothetical protein
MLGMHFTSFSFYFYFSLSACLISFFFVHLPFSVPLVHMEKKALLFHFSI